jgi:hypothetical protein
LNYVLFLIYLGLFSWLLTKSRFVANAGLSAKVIITLFVVKVITGCVHAWLLMRLSNLPDTMVFHKEGLIEYYLLFNNPKEYFSNIFRSGYDSGFAGLFSSTNSYWNDLTSNLIIKFLSICDIFSFGNYNVNVIFYNFVIFFGAIGLYRVFNTIYTNKSNLLVVTCFLLPSLLFFSSTIHKEGLILAAIGILVFNTYTALHKTGFTPKRIIYILLALCFIFLQRNYVLIAILPAAFAWILSQSKKYPPLITFILTYTIGAVIFFTTGLFSPKLNLPESVSKKQWDFEHLATPLTYIEVNTLSPTFKSFALNAPQALNHSLLRPYFTDIKLSRSLFPLAVELFFYELLLIFFIFFRHKVIAKDPFIFFGFFFSLSLLLIIGYTVPVIGAIVRYRSIYLPFILTPIICGINWQKVKVFLRIRN